MKPPRLRGNDIATLVVLYASGATIWILLSDSLLLLTSDHRIATVFSVLKGLLFVAVTTLLLYFVLSRIREVQHEPLVTRRLSGFERTVRTGMFFSVLIILGLGALQVRELASSTEAEAARQLGAVTELRAHQLEDWIGERSRDAELLGRQLSERIPFDADDFEEPMDELENLRQLLDLQALFAIDDSGRVLASSAGDHRPRDDWRETAAAQIVAGQLPSLRTPRHRHDAQGQHLHLDFLAPVPANGDRPQRTLVLRTDTSHLRARFLDRWPIARDSGKSLLFFHDGDRIRFIGTSEAEHQAIDARSLESRIGTGKLPVGEWLEGIDHRGIEVAGMAMKITGTDWYLLSKLDQQELTDDFIAGLKWVVGAIAIALVLPFALGLVLAQRHRLRLMQLVDQQRDERLALARHHDTLMNKARDMILLVDDEDRIVDANESAIDTLGWSLEELQSMTVGELRTPGEPDERSRPPESTDGALYETEYRTRDGTHIPLEINERGFEIDGRIFRQAFLRDISERRRQELRIVRLTELYRALSDGNQVIVRSHDRHQLFEGVCQALVESGSVAMAWIATVNEYGRVSVAAVEGSGAEHCIETTDVTTDPDSAGGRLPTVTCLREDREVWNQQPPGDFPDHAATAPATGHEWQVTAALPLRQGGRAVACLNVYEGRAHTFADEERRLLRELAMDISYALDHLSAVEALAKSEERWSFALEGAADGVWDWDLGTHRVYFSTRWKQMLGYTDEEIGQSLDEWRDRVHPADLDMALAAIEAHVSGRSDQYRSEHRLRTKAGGYIWVMDRGKVLSRDDEGRPLRMIGTHTDITARRDAEFALRAQTQRLEESQRIGRIGNWVYQPNEYRFSCSTQTLDLLGLTSDEDEGTLDTFLDKVVEPDRTRVRVWIEAIANEDKPGELIFQVSPADGHSRWLSARGRVDMNDDAREKRVLGTLQDVTDWHRNRTRIEQQLEELQRWSRVTLDREQRILELKHEINLLCKRVGETPRYATDSIAARDRTRS